MRLFILALFLPSCAFSQVRESWIDKPKEQWPAIAMINEVWFNNGERYVHPSFEYAATGFLIDTGKDTLAATVKHALWVAKTKSMKTTDLKDLKKWIMHPKGNVRDSVVIDKLINRDTSEMLSGPQSTIKDRDWIVFTTKYVSPNIQPLRPRYSPVSVGERIWYAGCPYNDSLCVTMESKVLGVEGDRIIFSIPENINLGGASGSPIIDENGFLIGILSGSTIVRKTAEPALYGLSTRYLQKIIKREKPLNTPLISIGGVLKSEIEKNGIAAGIKKYKSLLNDSTNFFKYSFGSDSEEINATGDYFMTSGKPEWAIQLYQLSAEQFPLSNTFLLLAKAYTADNKKSLAIEACEKAIGLNPENGEAKDLLKKLKEEK